MCLTTNQKWPKIAWKPITVYKVVYKNENSYKTVYRGASIHIGETYRESIFNMVKNRQLSLYIDDRKKYYDFYEGLHSVIDKDIATIISDYYIVSFPTEVVKCIIPRFSLYWIGDNGDIVSNKLKYVKSYNYASH